MSRSVGNSGLMWVAGLALALASSPAEAAPRSRSKPPKFDAKATAQLLTSGDPARLREGFAAVRAGGKDAAPVLPLLVRLLDRGLSRELAKEALGATAEIGEPSSSGDVARYAKHRDAEIRRAALGALTKVRGSAAVPTMRGALSDADARVRGAAASGLGALGAHEALPELTLALSRKVLEAAAAIGQLCRGDECEAFARQTTKLPLDVMTSGFQQILSRADVSDDQKVKIIERVRDLATGEAHRFLKGQAEGFSGSDRVKTALEQAARATAGAVDSKKEAP
ncbi:MAG: HEAT repeat domain-containing protein [Polyangiaceae bacterium]|nr:HEAT repeat domain-containing protein [Polyangiaceae bacterium]